MSYRKLEVNGTVFEYSIGKTHTKIRGVGAFPNTDVGSEYICGRCSCGSRSGNCDFNVSSKLQVRPKDLAAFIKNNNLKQKNS